MLTVRRLTSWTDVIANASPLNPPPWYTSASRNPPTVPRSCRPFLKEYVPKVKTVGLRGKANPKAKRLNYPEAWTIHLYESFFFGCIPVLLSDEAWVVAGFGCMWG